MRTSTLSATALSAVVTAGIGGPSRAHPAASRMWASARRAPAMHTARAARSVTRDHQTAPLRPSIVGHRSRSIRIPNSAAVRQFALVEPAGVIQVLRITMPHSTRVSLTASIPHIASVAMSAPQSRSPSQACERRARVNVCTQAEEACPMPAATWRFRLRKLAGPPGEIRVQFTVGQRSR